MDRREPSATCRAAAARFRPERTEIGTRRVISRLRKASKVAPDLAHHPIPLRAPVAVDRENGAAPFRLRRRRWLSPRRGCTGRSFRSRSRASPSSSSFRRSCWRPPSPAAGRECWSRSSASSTPRCDERRRVADDSEFGRAGGADFLGRRVAHGDPGRRLLPLDLAPRALRSARVARVVGDARRRSRSCPTSSSSSCRPLRACIARDPGSHLHLPGAKRHADSRRQHRFRARGARPARLARGAGRRASSSRTRRRMRSPRGLRESLRAAGVRAIHSTPLISRDGEILGALSVHFPAPRRPTRT